MYHSVTRGFCVFMLLIVIASTAAAGINDGLVAYFKLDETSGTPRSIPPAVETTGR